MCVSFANSGVIRLGWVWAKPPAGFQAGGIKGNVPQELNSGQGRKRILFEILQEVHRWP